MSKQTEEALRMAIKVLQDKCGYADEPCEKAINACKAALEQPTNMVTVPLDKLEDMQRRLKALENAREVALEWECEPKAWKYKRRDGEITATVNPDFALIVESDGFEVTPLYARKDK